jgi:hypothetical protein
MFDYSPSWHIGVGGVLVIISTALYYQPALLFFTADPEGHRKKLA